MDQTQSLVHAKQVSYITNQACWFKKKNQFGMIVVCQKDHKFQASLSRPCLKK